MFKQLENNILFWSTTDICKIIIRVKRESYTDLCNCRMAQCLTTERNNKDFLKDKNKIDGNSKWMDKPRLKCSQKLYNSVPYHKDELNAIKENIRTDLP